jgi:redox-sensitive bicupin YhaK (pirin superfamily)
MFKPIDRRKFLVRAGQVLASLTGAALILRAGAWFGLRLKSPKTQEPQSTQETAQMIQQQFPIDFQWPVQEPFLFCVHHYDRYPAGNGKFAPEARYLQGRDIGQDFTEKDGFRMYHGETVPGFPVHPHRGFETITIVRKGYVDHADSMGAAGRYGEGDVQWMTAGAGVQHSEMFPLLRQDSGNTVELFQIWLNLPRKNKMVTPHFSMFWSEKIPNVQSTDGKTQVSVIAGTWGGAQALSPPPDSWASDPQSETTILLVKMQSGGTFELPASAGKTNRMMYFFEGSGLALAGQPLPSKSAFSLQGQSALSLTAAQDGIEFLILQSRPIGEPVVQHGPFVMNSREEILQTFQDFQRTRFGGWSWEREDMVHGPEIRRFAKYPNGKIETPRV